MSNLALLVSLILSATVTFLPTTLAAQETTPEAKAKVAITQQQPSDGEQAVITLLKVLDQVGIIIPGIGFKSFQLGQTREQLIKLWGKPQQATRKILQYQLDSKTVIQFHGKKTIKNIAVIGRYGSMARVDNGVAFSMTPDQVMEFFDTRPDKNDNKKVRYKNLGIEFYFENQALVKINVFAP